MPSWEEFINGRTNSLTNPWLTGFSFLVDKKDIEDGGLKVKTWSFDEGIDWVGPGSATACWFEPKKIIYNGPATIVFWKDGSKTVVKCADMEQYNRYNAFCAALAKKIFGTNSKVNRVVKSGVVERHI